MIHNPPFPIQSKMIEEVLEENLETIKKIPLEDLPQTKMDKQRSKWLVLDDYRVVHVLPETDTKPHGIRKGEELSVELADLNCPCKPKIDMSGKKTLVVHNSFEEQDYLDNLIK